MNLLFYLKLYALTIPIFFIIDILWLGVIAKEFYRRHLGFILSPDVNWKAAILFYLVYIVGIIFFAVRPALNSNSWIQAAVLGLALAACGGAAEDGAEANAAADTDAMEVPATDAAAAGENLFTTRGCAGCHGIGGPAAAVGPDLAGVTERREQAWLVAMITRPDSMLTADETAMGLLAEYNTPMPNMRVSSAEAEQIIAYLSAESSQ